MCTLALASEHTWPSGLPIPTTNYVFERVCCICRRRNGVCYFRGCFFFPWKSLGTDPSGRMFARWWKPFRGRTGTFSHLLPSVSCPQINNKPCGTVTIPLQVSKDPSRVQQLVMESPIGQKCLSERDIKKAILSPRTPLINFLVNEWCMGVYQIVCSTWWAVASSCTHRQTNNVDILISYEREGMLVC